jgi:hypothetical protein
MIDVRLEAENHWLRYGRFAPRLLRQLQLRNLVLMDATLESEVLLSHRAIEAFDFTAHEMVNNDLFFEMKDPPNVAVNLA